MTTIQTTQLAFGTYAQAARTLVDPARTAGTSWIYTAFVRSSTARMVRHGITRWRDGNYVDAVGAATFTALQPGEWARIEGAARIPRHGRYDTLAVLVDLPTPGVAGELEIDGAGITPR